MLTEKEIKKKWRDTLSVGNGERTLEMVIKFARVIEQEVIDKQQPCPTCAVPKGFCLLSEYEELLNKITELEDELFQADESLKAIEAALKDVPYHGTYADGIEYLKS